jgi:hypothetical protein
MPFGERPLSASLPVALAISSFARSLGMISTQAWLCGLPIEIWEKIFDTFAVESGDYEIEPLTRVCKTWNVRRNHS